MFVREDITSLILLTIEEKPIESFYVGSRTFKIERITTFIFFFCVGLVTASTKFCNISISKKAKIVV